MMLYIIGRMMVKLVMMLVFSVFWLMRTMAGDTVLPNIEFVKETPVDTSQLGILMQKINLLEINQQDSAMVLLEQSLLLSRSQHDTAVSIYCLRMASEVYYFQGNFKKSLQYDLERLQLSKSWSTNDYLTSLNDVANNYQALADYKLSIQYRQLLDSLASACGDSVNWGYALLNIGGAYFEDKKDSMALRYYNRAYPVIADCGDSALIVKLNCSLAEYYLKNNQIQNAEEYLKVARGILEKEALVDLEAIVQTIYFWGEFCVQSKKYARAYSFFNEVEEINRINESSDLMTLTYLGMADVKVNNNERDSARYFIAKGLDYAKTGSLQLKCYMKFRDLFLDEGNYKKAYFYAQKFEQLNDSIHNEAYYRYVEEVQTRYETQKRERENHELKQQSINREMVIRNQKIAGAAITLISFLLFWFMVVFFNGRKKQKKLNRLLNDKQLLIEKKNAVLEQKNEEISQQSNLLKEANATKDKFFSIIAHDLKSPFNVVLGYAELLLQSYDDFDDNERKDFIGDLNNSARSAFDLLENLLTWSRSQQGRIFIEQEPVNLFSLVKQSIEPYGLNAKLKQIRLLNKIPDHVMVLVDRYTISITIANLVSNAIKFTHEKGVISIIANIMQHDIEVCVEDNGVGITANRLVDIFDDKINQSSEGTQNEKGTGLGLILCKEFVEKNGGQIWVESEEGRGSRFFFTLPKNNK